MVDSLPASITVVVKSLPKAIVEVEDTVTLDLTNAPPSVRVRFDGRASHDPDDGTDPGVGIHSYSWDFGGEPQNDADPTDSTDINPTVTYWQPGEKTVILTVWDNDPVAGASGSGSGTSNSQRGKQRQARRTFNVAGSISVTIHSETANKLTVDTDEPYTPLTIFYEIEGNIGFAYEKRVRLEITNTAGAVVLNKKDLELAVGRELSTTWDGSGNTNAYNSYVYGLHKAVVVLELDRDGEEEPENIKWEGVYRSDDGELEPHDITVDSEPVADAGDDQVVLLNPETNSVEVSFNGSGSIDPDGLGTPPAITNYSWDFSAANTADAGTPSSVTSAQPAATTTYYTPGVKTVTLIVTDNDSPPLDDQDTVEVKVVKLTPVLEPMDNFDGRSLSRFGIGEEINLNYTVEPPSNTAAEIGGLRWMKLSGNGELETPTNNEGVTEFHAATAPGSVTLKLSVLNGPMAGQGPTRTIEVILPSGAYLIQKPETGIAHIRNQFSVGLFALPYLLPRDVSFDKLIFREEFVRAVCDGYFLPDNGEEHRTGSWHGVGPGNITNGCRINLQDRIGIARNRTPYSAGNFRWLIPWAVGIKQTDPAQFVRIDKFADILQHAYAKDDEPGTAYIKKGQLGPFKADLADPTTSPPAGPGLLNNQYSK